MASLHMPCMESFTLIIPSAQWLPFHEDDNIPVIWMIILSNIYNYFDNLITIFFNHILVHTTNCTAPSLCAGKHNICLSADGSGETSQSPNRLSRVSQVKSRWGECGKENTCICRWHTTTNLKEKEYVNIHEKIKKYYW